MPPLASLLLLIAYASAQDAPAPDPLNLRVVYQMNSFSGVLTLEEDCLAVTEPPVAGFIRYWVYARHDAAPRVIASIDFLSAGPHFQVGRFAVTVGREFLMGDGNGDGDLNDYLLVAHDIFANATLHTYSAVYTSEGAGRNLATFSLHEAGEKRDVNGDGDRSDGVACAWDLGRGLLVSPKRASTYPRACERAFAYQVGESWMGQDLTGDGDTADAVYQVYDIPSSRLQNTGVAVTDTIALPDPLEKFGGRTFAFVASVGGSDQLHAYSIDREEARNLNVSSFLDTPYTFEVIDRWVVYGFKEILGTDANDDGDFDNLVLRVYDGRTGAIENSKLAIGLWYEQPALLSLFGESELGFLVPEFPQGADLNADGDRTDWIFHLRNLATGSTRNTGLSGLVSHGVLLAQELADGIDRNGDGDAIDSIPHILGPADGVDVDLGIAASDVRLSQQWCALVVAEGAQGSDLNGDGDLSDRVLHAYDRGTGRLVNLTFAVGVTDWALSGSTAAIPLVEAGVDDWNGDGDTLDAVMHLVDLETGAKHNLGLAVKSVRAPVLMSNELLVFPVNEVEQGADLDGNHSIQDFGVLHVVDGPFQSGAPLRQRMPGPRQRGG